MSYTFDQFQLNADTRELTRAGVAVSLEPQTFDLLLTLIANQDTVLSKNDLADAVWHGRYTSDAAIASGIKSARQALGDDGKTQRYIKTVHGIGYRFVGEIRPRHSTAAVKQEAPKERAAELEFADSRPVIVVTPFEDTEEPASILAGGLTHDVTVGLSRLRWLKVISWASATRLPRGEGGLLRPLTAADYGLSGRLEREAGALALAAELINLRDHSIVWAERFTASSGDINELRHAVVQQAVNALELQISTAEASKAQYLHTSDLDAW